MSQFQNPLSRFPGFCISIVVHALFLLLSCNYDPDDEYNVDIELKDPPTATITLNDYDSLIEIWLPTDFYYDFHPAGLTIQSIYVYLDEVKIASLQPGSYFTIDPANYPWRQHKLVLEITTNSGTGSLGDRLGAENLVYTKEWTLIMEKRTPFPLRITELIKENGMLKVSWEMCNLINFQKYILYRLKFTTGDGQDIYEPVAEFEDKESVSFYDSTYIGGLKKYYVAVQAGNAVAEGILSSVDFPLPRILETRTEGLNMVVVFTRCLFEANFEKYKIYQNWNEYHWNELEVSTISDINDTIVALNGLIFGASISLALATHWNNCPFTSDFRQYEPVTGVTTHLGDSSFAYIEIASAPPCSTVFFSSAPFGQGLYRYLTTEDRIYSVKQYNDYSFDYNRFTLSPDGNYLLYNDNFNDYVELFQTSMLQQPEVFLNFPNNSTLTLSNSNQTAMTYWGKLYMFDFNTNSYIDSITDAWHVGWPHISPDGNLIYFDSYDEPDMIYQYQDSSYVNVRNTLSSGSFLAFNPLNPDELVYYENNQIVVRNKTDLSVIRSFHLDNPPGTNIDPLSGYFMAKIGDNSLYGCGIYDIATGNQVTRLNTVNFAGYKTMAIYNKVIYGERGYKLKIE